MPTYKQIDDIRRAIQRGTATNMQVAIYAAYIAYTVQPRKVQS